MIFLAYEVYVKLNHNNVICILHYLRKIQVDLTQNPKSFWRYIISLKSDNDISNIMVIIDKSSTGEFEVTNIFKDFF